MGKQYGHLSSEERAVLQLEISNGASIRSISRCLSRSPSTLSRELGRQAGSAYAASLAAQVYGQRRGSCVRKRKLVEGSALFKGVRDHLVLYRWSPEQIAAKLRHMHPDDPTQRVSHEAIYVSIYAHPCGGLKKEMVDALRQSKPTRGRRRTTAAKRTWVPEDLRIVHRAEEVRQRLVPGHWEGDLINGAFNRSSVGTLVERKSRFVILCKMDGCTADATLEGFSRQLTKSPAEMRASMTYDWGTEMMCYAEPMGRLDMDVWLAYPHAPWQRGSNIPMAYCVTSCPTVRTCPWQVRSI